MNWSCHIEYIIPKLSSSCYVMRSIRPFMSPNTLKTVYYSYFNAVMSYGLPFWGNSPHAIKVFRMQKRKDNTPTDLTHTTPDEISLYTPHPIHTID